MSIWLHIGVQPNNSNTEDSIRILKKGFCSVMHKINTNFGFELKKLWKNSRSTIRKIGKLNRRTIVKMFKNSLPSDLNKKLWESNLVRFETAKNSKKYAKIVDSLDQMNKMPTEQHILDRFKCLAANVKSKSTVERKTENVLNKYEKDSRKPGTQDFTNLFNIHKEFKVSQDTKDDLNSEDEEQQKEKQDSDSGSQDSDALKEEEEIVWRDDMAFLHHLITCYRQFKKTGCFPKINFRTLPNISNAG
ncbi:hypothetical protein HELRODRAFT_167012 [Helobdella robusta]|uniref:Uncharacterized protein n=1 Tax=Helobdella robusta TaxID=6412 RepID=T1EYW4_HELRO|nr:hypothetical protein HELRODRAFT_167012 [Helobdella robusta]ESO11919.1 hypothetical protein HELRODRAFT_167012 [Helobdella robusta]